MTSEWCGGSRAGAARAEQVDAHDLVAGAGGRRRRAAAPCGWRPRPPGRRRPRRGGRAARGSRATSRAASRMAAARNSGSRLGPGRGRALRQRRVGEQHVGQLPEGGRLQVVEVQPAQERAALLADAVLGPVEQLVEVLPVLGEGGRAHGDEHRRALVQLAAPKASPRRISSKARRWNIKRAEVVGLGEQHVVLALRDLGQDVGVPRHPRDRRHHVADHACGTARGRPPCGPARRCRARGSGARRPGRSGAPCRTPCRRSRRSRPGCRRRCPGRAGRCAPGPGSGGRS